MYLVIAFLKKNKRENILTSVVSNIGGTSVENVAEQQQAIVKAVWQ